jgi:hypothetical protein
MLGTVSLEMSWEMLVLTTVLATNAYVSVMRDKMVSEVKREAEMT